MKRRDLLKNIGLGTAGVAISGTPLAAKEPETNKNSPIIKDDYDGLLPSDCIGGWQVKELKKNDALNKEKFFNEHEMATIAILSDIIIPKDAKSGSATDAKVPDFIEFIVKDMEHYQIPMRGGLSWLDLKSKAMFQNKKFTEITPNQRITLVELIAYPEDFLPENSQGVSFFSLMRNLTSCGFYTSEIGLQDLGYKGNTPNNWDGVPQSVLKKYNLSYADWEKHLKK